MNRFKLLQDELLVKERKKRKEKSEAVSRGRETERAQSLSNKDRLHAFNTPAYTLSTNPMNDEKEIDEGLISISASVSVAVPSFCTLSSATNASSANFSLTEFNCNDAAKTPVPESIRGNVQKLMEQLEVLRSKLNQPITINSGYRTVPYNKSIGGADQSMHLCGMAADIRVRDHTPTQIRDAIEELIAAGQMMQGGLGLYKTFVHYDIRGKKARWSQGTSESQSYYGESFAASYYDWPSRFGKGDAAYDAEAAKWIIANRDAVPVFAELNAVFRKDSRRISFKAATTDVMAKKAEGYVPIGHNYEGHPASDPLPNWNEADPVKKKVLEILYEELKHEGGISSVNAWDDQQVTLGWGFSLKFSRGKHNEGIKMLKYNFDSSSTLRNAMLEVGLTVINEQVIYFALTPARVLTGSDAMIGFKWNPKVLSKLITELEKIPQTNADINAKTFKEIRMKGVPAEFYTWPPDSMRLAMILSHWAPAGISWAALKTSNGEIATIVKSFSRRFHENYPGGYPTAYALSTNPNGSIYANDIRTVLARRGNKAFIKAAATGKFTSVDKAAFKEENKTDAQYKDYVFVELQGKVYLLP